MRLTKKSRARARLSLALRMLHEAESQAKHHARMLALTKKKLALHRESVRACTEDARQAGVL
jgi:hypothetical protein